jgi:hypothetical protein
MRVFQRLFEPRCSWRDSSLAKRPSAPRATASALERRTRSTCRCRELDGGSALDPERRSSGSASDKADGGHRLRHPPEKAIAFALERDGTTPTRLEPDLEELHRRPGRTRPGTGCPARDLGGVRT